MKTEGMQYKDAIKKHGKRVSRSLLSAMEVNAGLQRTPMKLTMNMSLQMTAGMVLEEITQMLSIK